MTYYPYEATDNFSFQFKTEQGLLYAVYFLDYSVMFSAYPHIANNIYSFNITVMEGETDIAFTDERIGITIVEIFRLFFEKIQNVAVYVCDSIDDRQLARKRKFDLWFWKYNDGTILKEDGIAVIDDVEILNSLLIHRENKYLTEIILAYKSINERANDK